MTDPKKRNRKLKIRSWIVPYEVTTRGITVVEAETAEAARALVDSGDFETQPGRGAHGLGLSRRGQGERMSDPKKLAEEIARLVGSVANIPNEARLAGQILPLLERAREEWVREQRETDARIVASFVDGGVVLAPGFLCNRIAAGQDKEAWNRSVDDAFASLRAPAAQEEKRDA